MKIKTIYCYKSITFQGKQENHISIPDKDNPKASNTRRFANTTLSYDATNNWVVVSSDKDRKIVPMVNIAWLEDYPKTASKKKD